MRAVLRWVLLAAALCGASASAGPGDAVIHESFDLQVPLLPAPVRVEGRARLHYELHLTNFAAEALRPLALEVGDASGLPLARFDAEALQARMALLGPADEAQLRGRVPPGRRAVVHLELEFAPATVPAALAHRLVYLREDGTEAALVGPRMALPATTPAAALGAPVRGGPWVVIHDAAWPRGHRRVFYTVGGRARLPGRFATDWVRVDRHGRTARGAPGLAHNALGYGAEVIAVADATVAAVRNDYPEHARVADNRKHPLADASGNHVVLDLGAGRYAFYEHLRPGSVRVAPGQRVTRGQVLGQLGFSGDSTGPHLHFHIADGVSPLGAEGQPFALDRFRVLGRYHDVSMLGQAPWVPRPKAETPQRSNEWPEGNSVLQLD